MYNHVALTFEVLYKRDIETPKDYIALCHRVAFALAYPRKKKKNIRPSHRVWQAMIDIRLGQSS